MLDLYELEQFAAFGECGTLSGAAERLHISQPTLTRNMRHIEDAFGVPLFNRTRNHIELNETGKLAVEYARKLLTEVEQAVEHVKAFDQRQRTIIVRSCAPAPLWELLKKLDKKAPGVTVSSSVSSNDEVLRSWEDGECNIAVLPFRGAAGNAEGAEFMRENLFVCVPREHELARHESLTFAEINGFNFLLRSELGFWDTLCRQKMPASRFLVQTDEFEFSELVRSSSLPCFTTDYFRQPGPEYEGRVNIPLTDAEARVTFFLLTRRQGTL